MELKKNHKVKMAKFHNGVQIGGNVFSSLPRAGFDAKCELSPNGALIELGKDVVLVTYANIEYMALHNECGN